MYSLPTFLSIADRTGVSESVSIVVERASSPYTPILLLSFLALGCFFMFKKYLKNKSSKEEINEQTQ